MDIASVWEELSYGDYSMYEPDRHLPLHPFEAKRPQGKRIMHLTIQPENETHASIVFHGCTWFFRDLWGDSGALPLTYEQDGQTIYCRVMEKVDMSREGGKEKVFNVLDNVLKNLLCRVHVDGGAVSGPVRLFVQALRARRDMFFA